MSANDWVLQAPWWSWPRPGTPARGRHTRPVFQKYDSARLVDTFMADPQRRLKFLDEVDRVSEFTGSSLAASTMVRTARRKLFQPSHFRHYLIVCSLHCDAPGMPPVDRGQVCQQGFVIRKRALTAGDADTAAARPKLAAVAMARRKVAAADGQIAAARRAPTVPAVRLATLHTRRAAALRVLTDAKAALASWAATAGIERSLEGWVPTGNDGEGDWADVPEYPDTLRELVHPLNALHVPAGRAHDAAGQTIYFGLVPTASADHESSPRRLPRFDDHSAYEIRCFVRRHAPGCLNEEGTGEADCRGQIVWSGPTEVFGLAAHFDARGTANRPVNISMPDLRALKAHAGQPGNGVQLTTPPLSSVTGDGPTNAGAQIHSVSVPLITIVAMFVLQVFLPIVVLLFQLWFLLLLKFSTPPDIQLDAALDAMLDLDPGDIDPTAFAAAVEANADAALGLFGPAPAMAGDANPSYKSDFNAQPLASRRSLLRTLVGKDVARAPVDDLVYEQRVEWADVVPA